MQYGLSQRTSDLMFAKADADGNGRLSLEEMIAFVKRCYQMLVDDGEFDERMMQVGGMQHPACDSFLATNVLIMSPTRILMLLTK